MIMGVKINIKNNMELNLCEVFEILENFPIFLITENYIKVISKNKNFDGYVTFSVGFKNDFIRNIRVGVFSISNKLYWFWYKKKHNKIEFYAPGVRRRKYHIGNLFELNREIYNKYKRCNI